MALNSLLCADVPLRNCSINQLLTTSTCSANDSVLRLLTFDIIKTNSRRPSSCYNIQAVQFSVTEDGTTVAAAGRKASHVNQTATSSSHNSRRGRGWLRRH